LHSPVETTDGCDGSIISSASFLLASSTARRRGNDTILGSSPLFLAVLLAERRGEPMMIV
jgi:hypothetical protein